jgi:purine-nucleoside phosphorylase
MSEVYDPALRAVLRRKARELSIDTAEGVYAQLTGPSFETPAEVRLLRSFGATAVGMSTACEAVAAGTWECGCAA